MRVYDSGGFSPSPVTSLPLEAYIEGASAGLVNKDGSSVIQVQNAGSLEYAVMGLVRGQKVHAGETRTLSFDASATVPRSMVVTAEDASYTRLLDRKVTLTQEPVHYSFAVTFAEDLSVDLKFQLGNIDGAAALGDHTVTLANITWE